MINIDRENNIYYKNNSKYFDELFQIVSNNRKTFARLLTHSKSYLLNWINNVLPDCIVKSVNFEYSISTKCAWIFLSLTDFPKCKMCNKNEKFKQKNINSLNGYLEYCCISCAQQSKEVQNKIINTNLKKYNKAYFSQTAEYVKKINTTNKIRYGTDWACQSAIVKKHIQQSMIDHFGVPSVFMSDEFKQKYVDTCMKRYGVRNGGCSRQAFNKMHRKYQYDNIQFDSSPELAYYIWLKDLSIKFEFQPATTFEYNFNRMKCIYCPDFYLIEEKQYVEIKGDHFFKDGKMICPWRKSTWTDEQYSAICNKYEAKRQCMLANNVKILKTSSDEVKQAIQHVKAKYGIDFFVKCKI